MSEGDFQSDLLANAYQAFKGVCASGCLIQKLRSVDSAMIRMPHYATNLVSKQAYKAPQEIVMPRSVIVRRVSKCYESKTT